MRVAVSNPAGRHWCRQAKMAAGLYLMYLAALGPFLAIAGTGRIDFLPRTLHDTIMAAAWPVYQVPIVRSLYDGYLELWYDDGLDWPTGKG